MSYSLHPNAQADFDAKADMILAMVRQRVDDTEPSTGDFLNIAGISVPVAVMWQSLQDSNIRTGVAFPLLDRAIRIEGDDFLPIVRLAEKIQQRRELSEAVGVQAVLDVLILWCKQRIRSETDTAFSRFLLDWLEEHATEHTIIFPIYQLWFAGVLRVCGVEIRTLQDAEVDRWYEQLVSDAEWRQHAEQERDNWRRRIGGRAAAFVTLTAEPGHALEQAYEKVERVLSVLRSFSPALVIPARRSFCTIYGMQQPRERTAFTIGANGLPSVSHPEIDGVTHWNLSEEALRELAAEGFVNTIALLDEASSRFQNDILRALTLYSRASLEPLAESKLLYIVSSIETLLLKNDNEPIQAAVSRRFAYVVGRNLEERQAVRSRFTAAYAARSGFVHHGATIDDYLMLQEFMDDAWSFFRGIVFKAASYPTKQEYIDAIEDTMLAGPPLPSD
jgi:hypothetical protein